LLLLLDALQILIEGELSGQVGVGTLGVELCWHSSNLDSLRWRRHVLWLVPIVEAALLVGSEVNLLDPWQGHGVRSLILLRQTVVLLYRVRMNHLAIVTMFRQQVIKNLEVEQLVVLMLDRRWSH